MTRTNVRKQIIQLLANNFIFIDCDNEQDVDLALYIIDSIQFMSFLVELERTFSIRIPDELVNFDNLRFLNQICTIIEELKSEK